MFTVVLYRPEIPPNTGNIGRLTLGTGCNLAVVGEPGFKISNEAAVSRAGLDYWDEVELSRYESWESYQSSCESQKYLLTKFADRPYYEPDYQPGDHLIFGGENRGAPGQVHESPGVKRICLPMLNKTRSFNLANSVSAVLFEALRQVKPDWFTRTPYSEE